MADNQSKSPDVAKDHDEFIQDELNIQDNEAYQTQSTSVTLGSNGDQARFLNSLGSSSRIIDNASMGSVLAMKKVKTESVRRKKSRKSRRGTKYGDGTCSKINEVNESGDEENPEPIPKIELNQDT